MSSPTNDLAQGASCNEVIHRITDLAKNVVNKGMTCTVSLLSDLSYAIPAPVFEMYFLTFYVSTITVSYVSGYLTLLYVRMYFFVTNKYFITYLMLTKITDGLNPLVSQASNLLETAIGSESHVDIIKNECISGLHLNREGDAALARNFIKYIKNKSNF